MGYPKNHKVRGLSRCTLLGVRKYKKPCRLGDRETPVTTQNTEALLPRICSCWVHRKGVNPKCNSSLQQAR